VALDSSTWWGGAALVERTGRAQPEVVAEVGLLVRDSHSVHLLRLLDLLLAEASWPRSSVDAFVATRGPGSFTGLRVGLGTVRGLGLSSGRPCLGVGTLEAMAEAFGPADRERVPLLDAARGEVFGARYAAAGSPPREIVAPWIGAVERAVEAGVAALAFGSGAQRYSGRLASAGLDGPPAAAPTSVAAGAGRIGLFRLDAGCGDGDGLSPLYLRPPDAELAADR
jgi:tRNA threonylcarbamoyladenosine biosynthesis protein TsaB